MTAPRSQGAQERLTAAQRLRQAANLANGSTVLGLAVARAARTDVRIGPRGLVLAGGYRWRLPFAGAFTLGNVVLCRCPADNLQLQPALLGHEERHCSQYAWCLGLPFLPLYLISAAWSLLRTRNPGTANIFERHAGLAAGGYPEPKQPRRPRRPGPSEVEA